VITKEESYEEKNWNEDWKKNVLPITVNERIGITPTWKASELISDLKILINPKMSFGTGNHESTRLMCRLIENYITPGSLWIDAGCGTGVLSILAVKLGAAKVFAFDNNIWAVENSKENFELNDVASSIEILEADVESAALPPSDFIAANLNRNIIIKSIHLLRNALISNEGRILVSGILSYDRDEIISIAKKNNLVLDSFLTEGEWIAFCFKVK